MPLVTPTKYCSWGYLHINVTKAKAGHSRTLTITCCWYSIWRLNSADLHHCLWQLWVCRPLLVKLRTRKVGGCLTPSGFKPLASRLHTNSVAAMLNELFWQQTQNNSAYRYAISSGLFTKQNVCGFDCLVCILFVNFETE